MPRASPRTSRSGRRSGRVLHLQVQGDRPGRLHVPLRHEARARAHRERDVRRDRRQPGEGAAEGRPRVRARRERVVPERRRDHAAGGLDMAKARSTAPDWTTFNGYANQYVTHPLTPSRARGRASTSSPPARRSRRPSTWSARSSTVHGPTAVTNPPQNGVQTVSVPPGGGGVFDVKIDEPGLYPFVSHAFAHVDLGQVACSRSATCAEPCRTDDARAACARVIASAAAVGRRRSSRASQLGARRRRGRAGIRGSGASSSQASAARPHPRPRRRAVTLVEYADLQCPYCAQCGAGHAADAGRGLRADGQTPDPVPRALVHRARLGHRPADRSRRAATAGSGTCSMGSTDARAARTRLGHRRRARRGSPRRRDWTDDARRAARRARVDAELEAALRRTGSGVGGTPALQVGRTGGPLSSSS